MNEWLRGQWSRVLAGWRRQLPSRERLRGVRHRWHRVLVLSGVTGAVVGLGVAGFEWLTANLLLDRVLTWSPWVVPFVPAVGLMLAWVVLRWPGRGASPALADEYLHGYHDPGYQIDSRGAVAKLMASVLTLGSGGAMGFEGPSIFLGTTVGQKLEHRFRQYFSDDDRRLLLVAGAAAGVAAIFKAPATGAIFALEMPYQEDTASHALLPALIASATSYLIYVGIFGVKSLLHIAGTPIIDARDLLGALALGVLAGIGARLFSMLLRAAKRNATSASPWRTVIAAAGLAAIAASSYLLYGQYLGIGPGYHAITWSVNAQRGLALIAALFALRAAATTLTVFGGGAGGVFIPLVVQGWLLGAFMEGSLSTHTSLFPVIGSAAFLGAGYRTPIAAVVFVAEATGRPGFIVPALVATAVAQLVMGNKSVTTYQLDRRRALPPET